MNSSRLPKLIVGLFLLSTAAFVGTTYQAQDGPWVRQLEESRKDWLLVRRGVPGVREVLPLAESTRSDASEPERILILFPKASPAYDTALARILRSFGARKRWSTFVLVYYRNADGRMHRYLRKAERGEFALIFAMGSTAARDLHDHYRTGRVPVVTVCAKDPVLLGLVDDYEGGSKTHIAYTSLNVPVAGQLSYLRRLRPDLRQIAIVYSKRNSSAVRSQVEPLRKVAEAAGIAVLDVAVQDPSAARSELELKVATATGVMGSKDPEGDQSVFWITGSTAVFAHMDVVLQKAEGFPVLAVTPSLVNGGPSSALLSIGVSFESNAELASVYALKILTGRARAGDLDVGLVMPPDIAIDMSKAKALGLAVPFSLFEAASVIYDYDGRLVRQNGRALPVKPPSE